MATLLARLDGFLLTDTFVHLDASFNLANEEKEIFFRKTRYLLSIHEGRHSLELLSLLGHYNPMLSREPLYIQVQVFTWVLFGATRLSKLDLVSVENI